MESRRPRSGSSQDQERGISPQQPERLQRLLAQAGLGSRRHCETLITAGRVAVNGHVVSVLGSKAGPGDRVTVDGKPVSVQARVYIAFYKPRGVLCTSSDPEGRRIALDFFSRVPQRIYTVGRLDGDSEGLLLLTNDGDFFHRLAHPSHHLSKQYEVTIDGCLTPEELKALEQPIYLDGRQTRGMKVLSSRVDEETEKTRLRLLLEEGRNRQIRRALESLGRRVNRLVRTHIGKLTLDGLTPGKHRALSAREVDSLFPGRGAEVVRSAGRPAAAQGRGRWNGGTRGGGGRPASGGITRRRG